MKATTPLSAKQTKSTNMINSGVVPAHGSKKKVKHRTKVANIVLSSKRPVTQPATGPSSGPRMADFKYNSKYLLSSNAPKYKVNGKFLTSILQIYL